MATMMPGTRHPVFLGDTEQGLQGVGGALAELPQETPVPQEVDAQHLRHREDILPMRHGGQDLLGHPGPELQHPLLMAGGTGLGYKGDPAAKK